MTTELIIADVVRRWTSEVLPDAPEAADAAATLAVRWYSGGASVSEACQEARRFVGSWSRHPSHRTNSAATLSIAS